MEEPKLTKIEEIEREIKLKIQAINLHLHDVKRLKRQIKQLKLDKAIFNQQRQLELPLSFKSGGHHEREKNRSN